ncbi:MAG: hypothetical protein KDI81_10810 [Xanthomonadales bacterium]|nr:hypothetical protein [Xanthomonadales bacterium]
MRASGLLSLVVSVGVVTAVLAAPGAMAAYHTDAPPLPEASGEAPAVPATTVWNQRRLHGSVLYFLDNASTRLRRYDFATSSWLSDITINGAADAFDVDATGIYVKFSNRVERVALDGSGSVVVPAVTAPLPYIEVVGNVLLMGSSDTVYAYNKTTGALVSSHVAYYSMRGISTIEAEGRMFGTTQGVSPADVVEVEYNPATGAVTNYFDSPYHGAYLIGDRTYAREAGGMVVDSSGIAYASNTLDYLGGLGGAVQGVAFLADRFVVMRGGELAVFTNDVRELGRMNAPAGLQDIMSYAGVPYGISGSINALTIVPLSLDAIAQPAPPPARSWAEAAPKADFILGDGNDLIMISQVEHAAYAFNPASWTQANPTPLYNGPLYAAFSPVNDTLYAAYAGGAIYAFPRASAGSASWFASTAATARGLATAGEYVFADDPSGAWDSHYTFGPSGTALSSVEWNYYSRQYEWDPVLRRMYFFRDGTSPNDLHWEQIGANGAIVAEGESPYHGEVNAVTPIRVSPNGSRIIIGSGQVFESAGLTFAGNLNSTVADIGWLNGDLYAVTPEPGPRLRRYNATYQVVQSGRVRGTPRRILPSSDGFVYVADVGASTIFGRLDGFLSKADLAVDPVATGSLFAGGSQINISVTVGNNGTVSSNGALVTADLSGLESPSWRCVPGTLVSGCANVVVNGSIANSLDLQDSGQATYQVSGSIPLSARNEVRIPISISPAVSASDPELRNNAVEVVLRLDRIFDHGFD